MSHHPTSQIDDLPPFLKPFGVALGVVGLVKNWNVNDILAALSAFGSFAIGIASLMSAIPKMVNSVSEWRNARKAKAGK